MSPFFLRYLHSEILTFILSDNVIIINSFIDLVYSSREFSKGEIESVNDTADFTTGLTEGYYLPKTYYKMGLVFIILINTEKEKYHRFCMKYIALIEAILYRVRKTIELACNKPSLLLPTMIQISSESAEWVKNLLLKAGVTTNKRNKPILHKMEPKKIRVNIFPFNKWFHGIHRSELRDTQTISNEKNAEQFFKNFCDLLQKLDTKEHNLFISSLITTTLTYHLGWVTTCFPLDNSYVYQKNSYNSLWIQMSELSGALGCPTIPCRTIIRTSRTNSVISEILHSLNYFIRFSKVEYRNVERTDIDSDNIIANAICRKAKNVGQREKLQLCYVGNCYFNLSDEDNIQNKPQFTVGDDENPENAYDNLENYNNTFITCFQVSHEAIDRNMNMLSTMRVGCGNLPRKGLYKVKSSFMMDNRELTTNSYSRNPTIPSRQPYEENITQAIMSEKQQQGKYSYNKCVKQGDTVHKLRVLVFPLPSMETVKSFNFASYESVLRNDSIGKYIPDMVIQGTVLSEKEYDKVKRETSVARNNLFFDRHVNDSVTVIGDVDTWNVNIYSSSIPGMKHYDSGTKAEISPLVENMLEITLQMWNHRLCANYCATHIEQRLLEICLHSLALANMLLDTDFCVMDLLTSTLHLQVNDIPLLLSVASIVTPEVTKKYGLSFQ